MKTVTELKLEWTWSADEVERARAKGQLPLPRYATDGAAGLDLCAAIDADLELAKPGVVKVPLGVCFAIPPGWVGLLFPRSSMGSEVYRLANCVGVIDSDYRGEVCAKFAVSIALARVPLIMRGTRIVQMVLVPAPQFELEQKDSLSATVRGAGGFGSTNP